MSHLCSEPVCSSANVCVGCSKTNRYFDWSRATIGLRLLFTLPANHVCRALDSECCPVPRLSLECTTTIEKSSSHRWQKTRGTFLQNSVKAHLTFNCDSAGYYFIKGSCAVYHSKRISQSYLTSDVELKWILFRDVTRLRLLLSVGKIVYKEDTVKAETTDLDSRIVWSPELSL